MVASSPTTGTLSILFKPSIMFRTIILPSRKLYVRCCSEFLFTSKEFFARNRDALHQLPSKENIKTIKLPDLMRELAQVKCEPPFPSPYYPLGAKTTILEEMDRFAQLLVSGKFESESGTFSRLILGERGIGKSLALRAGVCGLAAKYPTLSTLYFAYAPKTASGLGPLMANAMGMSDDSSQTVGSCLEELERRDQYLFVVVDEVSRMYTSRHDFNAKMQILNDLMLLGSQTSGRVCVFICGSSSVTTSLINRKAASDPAMVMQYPMLTDSPDLNHTKFRTMRPFAHSSSKADIIEIAKAHGFNDEFAEKCCASLYYFCGGNARLCSEYCHILSDTAGYTAEEMKSAIAELFDTTKSKEEDLRSPGDKALYGMLTAELVKKNKVILRGVIDGSVNPEDVDWFAIEPLSRDEVDAVLRRTDTAEVSIFRLVDFGLLSVNQDMQAYLYPSSPMLHGHALRRQ